MGSDGGEHWILSLSVIILVTLSQSLIFPVSHIVICKVRMREKSTSSPVVNFKLSFLEGPELLGSVFPSCGYTKECNIKVKFHKCIKCSILSLLLLFISLLLWLGWAENRENFKENYFRLITKFIQMKPVIQCWSIFKNVFLNLYSEISKEKNIFSSWGPS